MRQAAEAEAEAEAVLERERIRGRNSKRDEERLRQHTGDSVSSYERRSEIVDQMREPERTRERAREHRARARARERERRRQLEEPNHASSYYQARGSLDTQDGVGVDGDMMALQKRIHAIDQATEGGAEAEGVESQTFDGLR